MMADEQQHLEQDNLIQSMMIPIAPPIPASLQSKETKDQSASMDGQSLVMNALDLKWCFGNNKQIGLLNLCINDSRKIFLASSHIGVVYDFQTNQQKLLQGHRNSISCCTVSDDKRWLITADSGAESTIIIWDLTNYVPVQTYFNTHENGTISVAITPDSKFIASLSAEHPQVLAIWEWTTESEIPICTAEIDPKFGLQKNLRFNVENTFQLVTNSSNQALFYEWNMENGFVYYSPTLNDETFNKPVGKLLQSIFQSRSSRALTGTSLGNLVVWQAVDNKNSTSKCDKKAFKLFKFQEKSINVLTTMNDLIVIGDADGQVKFIDQELHVLMWYKHFKLGPISSLSFSQTTKDYASSYDLSPVENDATLEYEKFICKDFLISTTTAVVGHITKSGTKVDIVLQSSDSAVYGLACHPKLPRICFGNNNGYLQLWDYEKKESSAKRSFNKGSQITSLTFDHHGNYIAVGFKNGHLQIIDSVTLVDCLKAPFSYSKDAITQIVFSDDSEFLATAEQDYTVSVYKKNYLNQNGGSNAIATEIYTFLGRYRSHYKEIATLMFADSADKKSKRLLSIGKDRFLTEYDLEKSNYDELVIKERTRIEQYAVPLAMIPHPSISKEDFLLTVNDQWKYKLYNTTTKMCRKTLLGPTFGSLIKKLIMVPTEDSVYANKYMAYITEDKLGLQKFPLTGNPFDSIAIFAHPDGVANLAVSYDGTYLFTAGGDNSNLFMWKVNFQSLEAQSILGGPDLKPFYGLIDGGREGDFFKEMRQLFYYSQLRHHGLNENTERKIKLTIPLSEIPFVMRGLGFYPTEQEIEDMINEVKFSQYVDTNEYVDSINLDDFIKLYINHRPAFGLDPYEIYRAFKVLNRSSSYGNQVLTREEFLDELQSRGEHMTDYELADCLSHLMHADNEVDEMSPDELSGLIDKHLPSQITVDNFMTQLIGVPTENFDEILKTWEIIKTANTPRTARNRTRTDLNMQHDTLMNSMMLLKEDYDRLESARMLKSEMNEHQMNQQQSRLTNETTMMMAKEKSRVNNEKD